MGVLSFLSGSIGDLGSDLGMGGSHNNDTVDDGTTVHHDGILQGNYKGFLGIPAPSSSSCSSTQHHGDYGRKIRTCFLPSMLRDIQEKFGEKNSCTQPEYDMGEGWNEQIPAHKAFGASINHPWNQKNWGKSLAPDFHMPNAPFGEIAPIDRARVVWNSVQPRDYFGTDTAGNFLVERGRHFYYGPEPHTPLGDANGCGRDTHRMEDVEEYKPHSGQYLGDPMLYKLKKLSAATGRETSGKNL